MSSFIRNLQRRRLRSSADYEPSKQVTVVNDDGSYKTLRYTKGWLEVAAVTVLAQMKLANLLAPRFMPPRTKTPSKVWKETQPKPMVQGRETRQQRRAAARGYVGAVS